MASSELHVTKLRLPCHPHLSLIKSTVLYQLLEMPLVPLWTRAAQPQSLLLTNGDIGLADVQMDYFHRFPAIAVYFPTVFYTSVTTCSF